MTVHQNTLPTPELLPGSIAELEEMEQLGLLDENRRPLRMPAPPALERGPGWVPRTAIANPDVLNEAFDYFPIASSFSRGLRVDVAAGSRFLWISGTASIGDRGETIYPGDFRAQCWRTLRNIEQLLVSEGASWHDIIRTSCYLRDIERDYDAFNEIRTHFMASRGLDPLPASTGIQARLCRSDLLVEIEAIALLKITPEP